MVLRQFFEICMSYLTSSDIGITDKKHFHDFSLFSWQSVDENRSGSSPGFPYPVLLEEPRNSPLRTLERAFT